MDGTPKKRHPDQEESSLVTRAAITKSGRKVKRPAHLESPERTPAAPLSDDRKSVARKGKSVLEADQPVNSPAKGTPRKRALAKTDGTADEVKNSRKTIGATRKTIASLDETPKSMTENEKNKNPFPDVADEAGVSLSGRKIKVPAKLIDFESEIVFSPRKSAMSGEGEPRREPQVAAKTPGRPPKSAKKRTAQDDAVKQQEAEPARERVARAGADGRSTPPKTGVARDSDSEEASSRGESPARRTASRRAKSVGSTKSLDLDPEEEEANIVVKSARKPGRPKGKSAMKMNVESLVLPKTPRRRATTLLPVKPDADTTAANTTGRTPGRRAGKSLMPPTAEPTKEIDGSTTEISNETSRDDPKPSTSSALVKIHPSGLEPVSRSGRAIKPKRIFELEREEATNKTHNVEEKDSSDGGRKRKCEIPDQPTGMMSPEKKSNKGNVVSTKKDQCSVQVMKLDIDEIRNADTEGLISRSGRKIKAKKMFGFSDDESAGASDPTIVRSPQKHTAESKNSREKPTPIVAEKPTGNPKPAARKASTLPKLVTKASHEEEKDVDEADQSRDFVTKRGVDDHHHVQKTDEKQEVGAIDEPDSVKKPDIAIARVLIGPIDPFSPKKTSLASVRKIVQTNSEYLSGNTTTHKRGEEEPQHKAEPLAEVVGSSRSGRKIKPKKFFDDDDLNLTVGPATSFVGVKNKKNSTVASSPVKEGNFTNNPSADSQSCAGQKKLDEHRETTEVEETAATDVRVDITEAVAEPMDKNPVELKDLKHSSSAASQMDLQSTAKLQDEEAGEQKMEAVQKGIDIVEGATNIEEKKEESSANVATSHEESDCQSHIKGIETCASQIELQTLSSCKPTEGKDVSGAGSNFVAMENLQNKMQHVVATCTLTEDKKAVAPVITLSEEVLSDVPNDNDYLLDEVSFGEIEYLDDEVPGIVQHVKKPLPGVCARAASEKNEATAMISDPCRAIPTVTIIPETPIPGERLVDMNETFSPAKQSVVVIDITADTPQVGQMQSNHCPTPVATAPRTLDSKVSAQMVDNKCSPDKPPEVIEIVDSPAARAFCRQIDDATSGTEASGGGSATSTPLMTTTTFRGMPKALAAITQQERLVQAHEGRKRSLSAGAADTTMKRNVTFHSSANSTVLVDAIDERLMMKSLHKNDGTGEKSNTKRIGPRKRSLSEHKPTAGDVKPSKISRKVPNFKNIHANNFNRMESIAEFMKRKEQRATKLLHKADVVSSTDTKTSSQKPFIFKSAGGARQVPLFGNATTVSSTTTVTNQRTQKTSNLARPVRTAPSTATATASKLTKKKTNLTNQAGGMASRLQQYQAVFKPKQNASDASTTQTLPSGASTSPRPVEQLRTKQSKILKGVRTNRRFDLQMKHRDNLQQH